MSIQIQITTPVAVSSGTQHSTTSQEKCKPSRPSWEDGESDSEDDEILERAGMIPPAAASSLSQSSSNASLIVTNGTIRLQESPTMTGGLGISILGSGGSNGSQATSSVSGLPGVFGGVLSSASAAALSHAATEKAVARSRVAEGMLVIDSLQIEKLKLQFRDPETGRFDKALELQEFVDAFQSVLGKTRKEFKHMFMKVDANGDGSLSWDEFLEFLAPAGGSEGITASSDDPHSGGSSITFVRSRLGQVDFPGFAGSSKGTVTEGKALATASVHIPPPVSLSTRNQPVLSKKSTFHSGMISKVLYLPTYDRYVTGGRDGLVKFWSATDLSHVKTVKHSSCWISDLCFMKKSNRVAVCSMDRVITFYDPTTFEVVSRIRDVGSSRPLSSAPTCMDSAPIHNGEEEVLLIGDDSGNLLLYRMKSVHWHICDGRGGVSSCKHHEENTAKNYSDHVTVAKMVGLHDDWITSVKYDHRLGMVITSSLDRTIKQCDINKMTEIGGPGSGVGSSSAGAGTNGATGGQDLNGGTGANNALGSNLPLFGMEDIIRRTFTGHKKGIYSFDYSKKYKFMASCGLERKILLWDPFTCKLISTLSGHQSSIQQVSISDEKSLLLSLDFSKIIRIWNLKQNDGSNLVNIQTLYELDSLRSSSVPRNKVSGGGGRASGSGGGSIVLAGGLAPGGYRPENRIGCIFWDPWHQRLLSCNSRISIFNAKTLRDHGPKSHKFPLVAATYISNFNQVISGDIQGTIQVWDVDTGVSVFKFNCGLKLSCMTFDSGKRRLLTGSQDGQVKMWNFSNSQLLMEFRNSKASAPATTVSTSNRTSARRGGSTGSSAAEITSLEYLTMSKAHSISKYVLSTGLDRKVTVYLEGDGEKHDALFTLPATKMEGQNRSSNLKGFGRRAGRSSEDMEEENEASGESTPSPSSAAASASSIKNQGHKDDILCMVVCGSSHTIATGSYDGSICLWHFDSANFFAKLVPPPSSTNQSFKRAAEEAAAKSQAPGSKSSSGEHPAIKLSAPPQPPHRKGVSFSAAVSSVAGQEARDGYTRYTPASSPWEELTPLIERAVEKLVWLERQQILVSAGADGILRFWDVQRAIMLTDRLCRVGHTRSENILALKAVETVASNWQQRLALQEVMESKGGFQAGGGLSTAVSASILPGLQPSGGPAGIAQNPSSIMPSPSGSATPSHPHPQHRSSTQDLAVAAINAIDSAPPVHYTFLLTGDSLGHLIVWDLSALEFKFERSHTYQSGHHSRGSIMGRPSVPLPEMAVMVRPMAESIVPTNHWQAHESGAILSIDYLSSYKMLLTAGADGRVLLWTRSGTLVGMFGQSLGNDGSLDGCWDLHDPDTWRGNQGFQGHQNRSKSDSEEDSDTDGDSSSDEEEKTPTPTATVGKDDKRTLGRRSAAASAAVLPEPPRRRVRKAKPVTLASVYPPPAEELEYDESPPHTPIEDEGRTRSNTPDAEEQARLAAQREKNKASTVDSLAALGMQAIHDKENQRRKLAGLPSLEEEAASKRRAEEEKQISFSPALSGRTLGGAGSIIQGGASGSISTAASRKGSIVLGPGGFAFASPPGQTGMAQPGGSTRTSMRMSQTSMTGMTLKALLQAKRDSAGVSTGPAGGAASTSDGQLASTGSRAMLNQASTGRISPALRARGLPQLGGGGSSTAALNVPQPPSGANNPTGAAGSHRRHRGTKSDAASGEKGEKGHHGHASSTSSLPSVPPSPFVPLLATREGFAYFAATIFNKPLSSAHPSHNVPPPRGTKENPLVDRLVSRDTSAALQIESDEEQDDFYSNEGGHASTFFQSQHSDSFNSSGGGGGSLSARDDIEARRNKLIFGALLRGTRLPHEEEDEDEADEGLGLLRGESQHTSTASLASFRKGDSGKKKKPVQSQRMQGVSAANIRRRLGSLHLTSLPTGNSVLHTSIHASHKFEARTGTSTPFSSGSQSARSAKGAHGHAKQTLGYLRDYPIVEVPFATKGRDEENEETTR